MTDPDFKKEAQKYAYPIPSRTFILSVIAEKPQTKKQLIKHFKLNEAEYKPLAARLAAMVRDKQLSCNRRGQFSVFNDALVLTGTVALSSRGFGFVVLDKQYKADKDLKLSKTQTALVFHGERVRVRLLSNKKASFNAEIVEVIDRIKTLVGRVVVSGANCYLQPDDKRLNNYERRIRLPNEKPKQHKTQKVVQVLIQTYPTLSQPATAKILTVLGDYLSPGVEMQAAICRYQIPAVFNKGVRKETEGFPKQVLKKQFANRKDLTNLPLVTIDGADSKDFDDAVCAKKTKTGFRLWVAIADVSFYVKTAGELDKAAYERGNSVYFPNYVVPMLPEVLSNGLCSLNPNVNRLCLVCEMDIDTAGEVINYRFYEAIMRSQLRLTYEQVEQFLSKESNQSANELSVKGSVKKAVLYSLQTLNALYRVLHRNRLAQGALEFDLPQNQIIFNDEMRISRIVSKKRLEAHRLIEECMLLANKTAARYLSAADIPFLYRVHPQPKADKLAASAEFLKALGLTLPAEINIQTIQTLISQANKRPDWHIIQTVLLRSMQQAVYTPENSGHFGLGFSEYTHFTSPIRRYPDLLVHRAIKAALKGSKKSVTTKHIKPLIAAGEHCSMTERRADEAVRDVEQFLKCVFIKDKLGEVFSGCITAVVSFGLFVELDELFVEGLVHIKDISEDYFTFDEHHFCLKGRLSGKTYKLGDRVNVQVAAVSLDERRIELMID